ncbi:MAG: hypothetical protein JNM14_13795 [Ferruginibacter sp.]|nr:hypothetical protein [Ferruginibacter sp.]
MSRISYLIGLFILFIMIFSCSQTGKISKEFIAELNKPVNVLTDKLRFDGVYHKANNPTAKDKYLYGAVIFFNNGMAYSSGSFQSLEEFQQWHQKYGDDKKSLQLWGVYNIISDTIKAIILEPYPAGLIGAGKWYECHYNGIIKNKDSILQWHLVPPYPAVNLKAGENEWLIKHAQQPVDLYFKNVPVDKIIDPNNAWINKFRIK